MYKLDPHPSCDKVKARTDLRSEKNVDLIAMNLIGHRYKNLERTPIWEDP